MTEINLSELAREQREALRAQDYLGNHLADLLYADELDVLAVLETLRPVLPMASWLALTGSLEICPDHVCDAQICRDDEADCELGQEAKS